jgi:zinc/manganese transport system permease protein
MQWIQQYLFTPEMFASSQVTNALVAGAVVALISAILGYFVVLRGLSFIGHAVTDMGLTGAAGAALLGINVLWGLASFAVLAALGVGALSTRPRERDVVTGVILAVVLGVGALFLQLYSTSDAGQQATLLFGSVFYVDPSSTRLMIVLSALCLLVLAVLYRPLLFSSLHPETAEARGVPVRLISILFLLCMAVAVAEAAQIVGVLLSTALLIGPPATAAFLTARPGAGMAIAAVVGVAETWLGIDLAYVSYNWPPGQKGWPVSFFITALTLLGYLLARWARPAFRRRAAQPTPSAVEVGAWA